MPHLTTAEVPLMSHDGHLGNSYDSDDFRPDLEPADEPLDIPNYLNDDDEDESGDLDRKEMESAFSSFSMNEDRCSSLASWGDDDFDKQACKAVADMFADIDAVLYDGASTSNTNLEAECNDWRKRFPHLRVVGKQILPTVEKGYSTHPRPPSVILTHPGKSTTKQSGRLSVVGKKFDESRKEGEFELSQSGFQEEIIEQHGSYEETIAVDSVHNSPQRKRNLSDKKKSLKQTTREQLLAVVFDNLWKSVVPVILPLVQEYSKRHKTTEYIQDTPRPNNTIFDELSIDKSIDIDKTPRIEPISKPPKSPGPPERLLIDTYLTSAKNQRLSPLPETPTVVQHSVVEKQKSNKFIRELSEVDKIEPIKPLPPLFGGSKLNKYGSRVVSAAHHRTVRFLQPIPAKPKTAIPRRTDKNFKSNNRWSFRLPPINNNDSQQQSARSNATLDNGLALHREESLVQRSKTLEDFMPLLRSSSIPPTTMYKSKETHLATVESLSTSEESEEEEVINTIKTVTIGESKPLESERKLTRPQTKQNSPLRPIHRGVVTKISASPRYTSAMRSKLELKKSNSLSPVRKKKPLPFRV